MTDSLHDRVTNQLEHVEQLAHEYRQWRSDIILGTRTDDPTHLKAQLDDETCATISAWEAIGSPDDLRARIEALPDYDRWRIQSFTDPDTNTAFNNIVNADTWRPAPLDAHNTPPPYPLHTLPDWAQEHAQHVADQIQTPVDLTAMLIIGSLSAALTGRATIRISANWAEPVNLYLVTAMDSGAGKSAAEKLTCQWLRDWQRDRMDAVMDDYKLAKRLHRVAEKRVEKVQQGMEVGSQSMDDLTEALRELDEAAMKIPEMPRILADDATPEAVATLLAAHGERLAIMSTEADLFDMVLKGKTGQRANFNVYLKAWSGDSLIRDRKGGSENGPEMTNLHHPLMTVACTVQPAVLARLSHDEEMASRGFSARFMMSMPEGKVGSRDQDMRFSDTRIPTTDIYAKTATALADEWAQWDKTELTVTNNARDELRQFLVEMEPQIAKGARYEHLAEWSSKLYGSMARYAALLHLAEGHSPATPVSHDTATRAVELARYWWDTADIILSMGDETTEQARAILGWIDRSNVAEFKVRDLQRHVQRKTIGLDQAVDYVPALELLVEMGWLMPSDPDWADKVGVQKKSAGYFSVWSKPTTESAYVGKVECRSMGERESLPPPSDTPTGGPIPTPDIPDISDTTPVDNPTPDPVPDYSHIDF